MKDETAGKWNEGNTGSHVSSIVFIYLYSLTQILLTDYN